MKKYLTPFVIAFVSEIIIVSLMVLGFFPREFSWILTLGLIFYIIITPIEDALFLFVASIPLFIALPISETFDSMSNWRILLVILFLTLFIKQGISLSIIFNRSERWWKKIQIKENLKHYYLDYAAGIFLLLGTLSLFAADNIFAGVKKVIFFINVFLLFSTIRNIAKTKETIFKIFKACSIAAGTATAIAYLQFISIFFTPLYNFWQWWADNVIPVFYGKTLGSLLAVSNTWFSYYQTGPATLRMFSIFPDSHSFGLFMVLSIPLMLTLIHIKNQSGKYFATGIFLLAAILSGSRGIWLSVVPAFMVALYLYFKKTEWKILLKPLLVSFFIFIFLFPVSSIALGLSREKNEETGNIQTFSLAFDRAKSISDTTETSNLSRLQIWKKSFQSIIKRPFLGVGIGNYPVVLEQNIEAGKRGASAHNLYLDIASEMGIPAMFVLIFMFIEILKISLQIIKKSQDMFFSGFATTFGIYIFWILSYNFFDVVLLNDKVLLFFVTLVAILLSIKHLLYYESKTVSLN